MSGTGTDQFVLLATIPPKPGCEDEYLALVNELNIIVGADHDVA